MLSALSFFDVLTVWNTVPETILIRVVFYFTSNPYSHLGQFPPLQNTCCHRPLCMMVPTDFSRFIDILYRVKIYRNISGGGGVRYPPFLAFFCQMSFSVLQFPSLSSPRLSVGRRCRQMPSKTWSKRLAATSCPRYTSSSRAMRYVGIHNTCFSIHICCCACILNLCSIRDCMKAPCLASTEFGCFSPTATWSRGQPEEQQTNRQRTEGRPRRFKTTPVWPLYFSWCTTLSYRLDGVRPGVHDWDIRHPDLEDPESPERQGQSITVSAKDPVTWLQNQDEGYSFRKQSNLGNNAMMFNDT